MVDKFGDSNERGPRGAKGDPGEDAHSVSPISDHYHYIAFIMSRKYTMVPLSGVCEIETNMAMGTGSKTIHTLLDSGCRSDYCYFEAQNVNGGYIQVYYALNVWVKSWAFMIQEKHELLAKFKWQTSIDGTTWTDISDAIISTHDTPQKANKAMWVIENPAAIGTKSKYWRVLGLPGGELLSSHPWVNYMLMDIE